METYKKIDIAKSQLETAIRFFLVGEDYFSSITLAGAAEEIYGKILQLLGKESALHSYSRSMEELAPVLLGTEIDANEVRKLMNFPRNALKHFNDLAEQTVTIDPEKCARDLIHRAVLNFRKVGMQESLVVERFEKLFDEDI